MAKVTDASIKISGKLDGKVHVQNKGSYIIRAAPKKTGKKSIEFTRQQERTGFINNLASELNKIIPFYAGTLSRKTFYERLKKVFRSESLDSRYLMLLQLKGMEINTDYPLTMHSRFTTVVRKQKNGIAVELRVISHPMRPVYHANCYSYELTLLCWDESKRPATHSRQLSDWISTRDEHPVFEFLFPKVKGLTHWLLCVKVILGVDNRRVEAFVAEGMQLFDIGSFNKAEIAMQKERAASKLMRPEIAEDKTEVTRVKAKRFS